jgi:hypothetical protein
VKQAARARLENASDLMARELLGIAINGESESNRLAATRDALDRSGLRPPSEVVLSQGKPYEEIFDDIASGSRSESRAARGFPDESIEPIDFDSDRQAPAPVESEEPLRAPESEDLHGGHRRYRVDHVTGYEAFERAATFTLVSTESIELCSRPKRQAHQHLCWLGYLYDESTRQFRILPGAQGHNARPEAVFGRWCG